MRPSRSGRNSQTRFHTNIARRTVLQTHRCALAEERWSSQLADGDAGWDDANALRAPSVTARTCRNASPSCAGCAVEAALPDDRFSAMNLASQMPALGR